MVAGPSSTSPPCRHRGNKDEGSDDQGIVFGYVCSETPELMHAPTPLGHNILRAIAEAGHAGKEPLLGPDAKSHTLKLEEGNRLA